MKTVIIGGGVGGLYTAYYFLKEGAEGSTITIVSKERPYTRHKLSEILRDFSGINNAYLRIYELLQEKGVNIVFDEAIDLRPKSKEVVLKEGKIAYDNLVLATGGEPFKPLIPGVGLSNVIFFYDIESLKKLNSLRRKLRIAVVGAGLVGLTAAVALHVRGHKVVVYEMLPQVLSEVIDSVPAKYVWKYLREKGLEINLNEGVRELKGVKRVREVRTSLGIRGVDLVVMAVGVRPHSDLAIKAGLKTLRGAVKINRRAISSEESIYALGDVALSHDYITGKEVYRPLGFIAAHYAKVAAKNIAGEAIETQGVIPTIYESILGLNVIRVGLSMREAIHLDLSPQIECNKEASRIECFVKDKGKDIVGYELVATDFVKRSRAWDTYVSIKENYSKG